MSIDLEPNDELENLNEDEIQEELLEADLLMQEELDEDFDEKIDLDIEDDDFDEKEDSVINSINFDEDAESELDVYFKYGTNNHKLDGKHSLKRDTILNGKLTDPNETTDELQSHGIMDFDLYDTGDIPIERGSIFEEESKNADDLQSRRQLAEDVYYLLKNNTDLDFRSNRRKPNKATFNNYYKMLLINIDSQYTKNEIFVELAYYFTDNIFNMYKLLDKKYAISIIKELREKGHLKNLDGLNFS
jgi:hypothetical protein